MFYSKAVLSKTVGNTGFPSRTNCFSMNTIEQVGQITILGSWSTENNLILTPEEQTCQYVGWVSSALDMCLNGKLKHMAEI